MNGIHILAINAILTKNVLYIYVLLILGLVLTGVTKVMPGHLIRVCMWVTHNNMREGTSDG